MRKPRLPAVRRGNNPYEKMVQYLANTSSERGPQGPQGPQGPSGGVGSGSSANATIVTVDFGDTETHDASVVVAGLSWASSSKAYVASVIGTTTDHASPEEQLIEQVVVTIGNIVNGTGFTVYAHAPNKTTGEYKVHVVGLATS